LWDDAWRYLAGWTLAGGAVGLYKDVVVPFLILGWVSFIFFTVAQNLFNPRRSLWWTLAFVVGVPAVLLSAFFALILANGGIPGH
jgi:uncharacterized membrane protein (UPF0136 family)